MATINCIYTLWPEHCGFTGDSPQIFGDTLAACLNGYLDEIIQYYVFQIEKGVEQEHPHVQLYIQWQAKTRPDRLGRLLGLERRAFHWDGQRFGGRHAAEAMRNYCSKEDGRICGPWEGGEFIHQQQGARSDLRCFADGIVKGEHLRKLAMERPDTYVRFHKGFEALIELLDEPSLEPIEEREVIVLVGPTNCGKTHWVKAQAKSDGGGLYQVPVNFNKSAFWLDGYRNQQSALIDDFDGGIGVEAVLRLLHNWEERVPVKGKHTIWRPKKIYITTNVPIEKWYPNISAEHFAALERRITKVINFSVPDEGAPAAGPAVAVAEVPRDNTSPLGTFDFGPGEMDIEEFLM